MLVNYYLGMEREDMLTIALDLPDNYEENKYYIRIAKIALTDFKSIEYGEITLNCGRETVPFNSQSDILGIYGQNGSGKTSIIEALSILKSLLSGEDVMPIYANCIRIGCDHSTLKFTFDVQNDRNDRMTIVYSFSIRKTEKVGQNEQRVEDSGDNDRFPYRVTVFNEKLEFAGPLNGKAWRMTQFINTESDEYPFIPVTKYKELVSQDIKIKYKLIALRDVIKMKESRSFIFSPELFKEIKDKCGYSEFYIILNNFRLYGLGYLFVVDTKLSGLIRLNLAVPFFTHKGIVELSDSTWLSADFFKDVSNSVNGVREVLSSLVPGLSLKLVQKAEKKSKNGTDGYIVSLVATRDGREMPANYESDGIRKLFSILDLFVYAFKRPCTVAIDEFDAGIFEYLLGELLEIFEESGTGQFIFTSHNLRPLEVISNKYICFSTTNPKNRFIHFKGLGNTNNLRSKYFKELMLGSEQDEELYNSSKRFKLKKTLLKTQIASDSTETDIE